MCTFVMRVSVTGASVMKVERDQLLLQDGRVIPFGVCVWCVRIAGAFCLYIYLCLSLTLPGRQSPMFLFSPCPAQTLS